MASHSSIIESNVWDGSEFTFFLRSFSPLLLHHTSNPPPLDTTPCHWRHPGSSELTWPRIAQILQTLSSDSPNLRNLFFLLCPPTVLFTQQHKNASRRLHSSRKRRPGRGDAPRVWSKKGPQDRVWLHGFCHSGQHPRDCLWFDVGLTGYYDEYFGGGGEREKSHRPANN
jgi:hypothetical protein